MLAALAAAALAVALLPALAGDAWTPQWPAALLVSLVAVAVVAAARVAVSARTAERSRPASRPTAVAVPVAAASACIAVALLSPPDAPQIVPAGLGLMLVVVRLASSLRANAGLLRSLREQALTDSLTGLPNRALLIDRLQRALVRQLRHGGIVGVLFLDVDEFKAVNDAYGQAVGDAVLVAVADRLGTVLRGEDTIARDVHGTPAFEGVVGRLGGDEFVIVVEGLTDPADAVLVAERVLAALRVPLQAGTDEIVLEASVGITVSDAAGGRDGADLLRDADTAMGEAKRAGKAGHTFFEREMREAVVDRAALLRDLRHAAGGHQLRLVYQPQVDLRSGRITGVEALVRWEHPQLGLLTPDRFIALAESSGIIVAIDDWVLDEACRQLRAWDDAELPALEMAVNVSAHRLVNGDLAGRVATTLRRLGVAAPRLELEITETVAVHHAEDAVAAITRVRALGVRVAIDDFGMGHSALSRLQSFPVDRLKIDRSFVSPLAVGTERGSIADAMIAMGQSLGLQVIAEGVETEEHLAALRNLGCGSGQGYLFSRPVAAGQIEGFARAGARLGPFVAVPARAEGASPDRTPRDRLARTLLAELQRLTGLETTYLTRIDWEQSLQHITHARNTGTIEIPEGLAVDWGDTVCRRALEQGVSYTDDVPATFPDSAAAADLGLRTYVSVPLRNRDGEVEGTLCGASSVPVALGAEVLPVMERFAEIIGSGVSAHRP